MKAIYPALLLSLLLLCPKTHALPVDLSAPSGGLGPTSDQGAAVHWLEMTEIDFGQGLALPLRMAFRTNWKSTDDELGGGFWSTPLHESKLHSISKDTKTVLLPCGKQMSLEPAAGKPGVWQTPDGEWVTRQKGPFTVVAREDGWEMEFNAKGQLIRLQNDAKRNVLWTRDAAGRVLSLAELTNGKTQPPAYTVDRDPKTGRINALSVKTAHGTKQWLYTYKDAKLKRVGFPDTSEVTFNETTRQDGQPQIAITGRDAILTTLTWDKTSHLLLNDGIWTYTITAQAGSKPIMTRVGPNGETEIQHDDSANHRSLFTAVDGTLTTHQKVVSGPAKGKTASITRLLANIDKPITTYQAEYDARGLLIAETDALGRKTTHNYTLHGATIHSGIKLHSSTDPLGHSSSKEYDKHGNLVAITNALGQVTKNEFDQQNRLTKTIGPDGTVVRSMTYNAAGQIATRTDAAGATTKFSYDKDGHPVSTTDALGNVTRDFYDQRGNRVQRRDALGNTWRYEYDKGGRLAQTIAPDGQTTEHRKYNSQGRLTEVTDAAGNSERTEYDTFGRVTAKTDALGRTTTLTYNAAAGASGCQTCNASSLATLITLPSGRQIHRRYTADKKLIEESITSGTGVPPVPSGTGVSPVARPAGVSPASTTQHTYDLVGNLISTTDPLGRITRHEYDANNRRIKTLHPDATTRLMAYNAAGQMTSQTNEEGQTTKLDYEAYGNLTAMTDPAGNKTTRRYEGKGYAPLHRLEAQISPEGRMTRSVYDLLGRRTHQITGERQQTKPQALPLQVWPLTVWLLLSPPRSITTTPSATKPSPPIPKAVTSPTPTTPATAASPPRTPLAASGNTATPPTPELLAIPLAAVPTRSATPKPSPPPSPTAAPRRASPMPQANSSKPKTPRATASNTSTIPTVASAPSSMPEPASPAGPMIRRAS